MERTILGAKPLGFLGDRHPMRRQRGSDSGGHPSKVNDADLRALLASGLSMVVVGEKLGISSATVCRCARRLAT